MLPVDFRRNCVKCEFLTNVRSFCFRPTFINQRAFPTNMHSGRLRLTERWPIEQEATTVGVQTENLTQAVQRTRDWLLAQQHEEGYWVGELQGDTILESEYILLLAYLGQGQSELARACAEYILRQQLPDGGWALYPGGPIEISASIKAYWALKITGHDPHSGQMQCAKQAILAAGGAERVNSFTRYYFALLGIISYQQCPAVPPELMLLPKWCPFNIYEMSAWSRTILVPLSLLWAFQPSISLPPEHRIDELFLTSPEKLPVTMPPSEQVDAMKRRSLVPWHTVFNGIDRVWKFFETIRTKPFRRRAIRLAADWMIRRLDHSDGLGAIFPPIIWSIVALRCLGYDDKSSEMQAQLRELEKLTIREHDAARLEPCRSPVWDTALATIALREAGVSAADPHLSRAVDWLISKEVRQPGDWSVRRPKTPPAGWYFEFNNSFYPDVDDTIMVTMALAKCLSRDGDSTWAADVIPMGSQPACTDLELSTVVMGQAPSWTSAHQKVERMVPLLQSIRRAVKWTLAMQSRNGGWGAFDADNDREILTRVPFADHNAMIDPPTADITSRVLEMFGRLGFAADHKSLRNALEFVWKEQEPDGAWYGRWGVNYLYGTWQVLVGLREIGVSTSDPRIQAAAVWLKRCQQESGGWGETARSYDEPRLRGQGPATASQTAWALMGLMAAGEVQSESVRRGIEYLLATQQPDGTWDEPWFTGTGFPRVFYLKYHLYRIYFPLMALGRYRTMLGAREAD